MDQVFVDNYEDFDCLVQQNIANNYGYSDQPPFIVSMETKAWRQEYWHQASMFNFKRSK